jgi:Spy/CpxP family protein refolding chaperone
MKIWKAILLSSLLSLAPPAVRAAQTTSAPAASPACADQCSPPAVVASFLNLTPAQTAEFQALLGQFLPAIQELKGQIMVLQKQLETELDQPQPNPAAIVALNLQIHGRQQQIDRAVRSFQTQFAGMLTEQQRQQVQAVALASQLQPVAGAFVALKLAPAPTPLPCQPQ